MDYTALYTQSVERWRSLAATLEHHLWNVHVPATPTWTVAQVAAHVAGVTSDVLAGRLDGAPGEAWTARQVSERQGKFGVEILEAWSSDAPLLASRMADPQYYRVALDAWNHYVDVLGALERPVPMTNPAHDGECRTVVEATLAWVNTRWPADLAPLTLRTPEGHFWVAEASGPDARPVTSGTVADTAAPGGAAKAEATSYEWARALAGRRTLDQMRAFSWGVDPEPYLAHLSLFPPPAAPLPS